MFRIGQQDDFGGPRPDTQGLADEAGVSQNGLGFEHAIDCAAIDQQSLPLTGGLRADDFAWQPFVDQRWRRCLQATQCRVLAFQRLEAQRPDLQFALMGTQLGIFRLQFRAGLQHILQPASGGGRRIDRKIQRVGDCGQAVARAFKPAAALIEKHQGNGGCSVERKAKPD